LLSTETFRGVRTTPAIPPIVTFQLRPAHYSSAFRALHRQHGKLAVACAATKAIVVRR